MLDGGMRKQLIDEAVEAYLSRERGRVDERRDPLVD